MNYIVERILDWENTFSTVGSGSKRSSYTEYTIQWIYMYMYMYMYILRVKKEQALKLKTVTHKHVQNQMAIKVYY